MTGGWLNAARLTGTIWHKGGILFLAPATGKKIEVSNFVISVHQGVLAAEVNGNPKVRVPLLRLNLAHATIHAGRHYVRISGIVLTLTKAAASALERHETPDPLRSNAPEPGSSASGSAN